MTEPLAEGRDEVIYLICSHDRIVLGGNLDEDGRHRVYRADGGIGGPFGYDMSTVWARVRFPDGVGPSALGWAVLDPLIEQVEGLTPDGTFDPERDPEGEAGRHRHELMAWIFDRHVELANPPEVDRGTVDDGNIAFELEYIGKAGREALRRAAGAHHKMPLILQRTLAYDPHRLLYVLPCTINAVVTETRENVMVPELTEAIGQTGLERDLIIAAAEEALIAGIGAPYNQQNTGARLFPNSAAGERLAAEGITSVIVAFAGIPARTTIRGERHEITRGSRGIEFTLARPLVDD